MTILSIYLCFICGCAGSSLLRGFSPAALSRGHSLAAVHGLFAVMASLVEHRLEGTRASAAVARGLSPCGAQTLEHRRSSCGAWA